MKRSLFFIVIFFFSIQCFASHIRGGEITIKRTIFSSYSCQITLKGLVHLSPVKPGGGTLDFGDGSPLVITPGEPSGPAGALFWTYEFTIQHTFPGPGFYRVTYFEQNLDAGIINMSNSVETPMFLESGFALDPLLNSPPLVFACDPILQFTIGRPYSFSSAPVDTISSIYNYELVVPEQAKGTFVSNYIFPENLKINSQTGLLTWDTKFQNIYTQGEYLVSVRVNQFDKNMNYLGYVTRVFSILLQETFSKFLVSNPIKDSLGKVLVMPGNQKKIKVILSDTISMDSIFWNAYYEPALGNHISFNQYDSASSTKKIKVGILTLTADNQIARELPYEIILRGTSVFSSLSLENGITSLSRDLSFLFFTKDVDLPVVTAVAPSDGEISVYPNPCTNELHFSGVKNGRVDVTNNLGQLLIQFAVGTDEYINTSTLSPGMYFFILSEKTRRYFFKVLKK